MLWVGRLSGLLNALHIYMFMHVHTIFFFFFSLSQFVLLLWWFAWALHFCWTNGNIKNDTSMDKVQTMPIPNPFSFIHIEIRAHTRHLIKSCRYGVRIAPIRYSFIDPGNRKIKSKTQRTTWFTVPCHLNTAPIIWLHIELSNKRLAAKRHWRGCAKFEETNVKNGNRSIWSKGILLGEIIPIAENMLDKDNNNINNYFCSRFTSTNGRQQN